MQHQILPQANILALRTTLVLLYQRRPSSLRDIKNAQPESGVLTKTGRVVGWIDLTGLLDPRDAAGVDVLNGIAYDAAKDRLFVTGKLWPRVFEIQIVPR